MMLRNHRALTVTMDGGGLGGGRLMAWPTVDCSTRIRRSFVPVSSSRSDIASRANAVTIAVNKAAYPEFRNHNKKIVLPSR